jgi:hypothetical protein
LVIKRVKIKIKPAKKYISIQLGGETQGKMEAFRKNERQGETQGKGRRSGKMKDRVKLRVKWRRSEKMKDRVKLRVKEKQGETQKTINEIVGTCITGTRLLGC